MTPLWTGINGEQLEQILEHKGYHQSGFATNDELGITVNNFYVPGKVQNILLVDATRFDSNDSRIKPGESYRVYVKTVE